MPWYLTCYNATPQEGKANPHSIVGSYSASVWAKTKRHAERLCRQRNIGEVVYGGPTQWQRIERPSSLLAKRTLSHKDKLAVIHSVCFLSYCLMRCIKLPPWAVVGDKGLLHETVHCLSFGRPRRKELIAKLEHFESIVPGFIGGGVDDRRKGKRKAPR